MFKDNQGKVSMMRVALAVCLVAGFLLITGGIVATFKELSGAGTLVNAGAGLMSVSGISKAFQSRGE